MATFASRSIELKNRQAAVVRSAAPEDAAGVLEIGRAVLAESPFVVMCPDELPATVEEEREWIRTYAEAAGKLILTVEVGDALVGILAFESGERRRIAHRGTLGMSVLKEWRDQGIGRALLEGLIHWGNEHPVLEKLCLSVFATNERAIALYRKMGFVEEGRCPRAIKLSPGSYADELLMHRFVCETT